MLQNIFILENLTQEVLCISFIFPARIGGITCILPSCIWIGISAKMGCIKTLSAFYTLLVIEWFLPNRKVVLLNYFHPADAPGYFLNCILFLFQIFCCSLPAPPVFLPTNWGARENPIASWS